ncbi:MAG TPA: hypothetical protein VE693_06735 [Gaiellaceae bacterium]|nr:hypothetical protein [Gaiellaceae bacterium]
MRRGEGFSVAASGNDRPVLGRWRRKREDARAAKQQADPEALAREGDPRGGLQSDEYRTADPREVVEEEGVVMSGPGGAPQEGESAEERRARDRGEDPA